MTTLARLAWSTELTEQARIDADRGELRLWGSALVLMAAEFVARWSWRTPVWSGALLPAAGAVSLLVHRSIRDPSPG